jgi:membrane-bound ClpP family serine protease
MDRKLAITRLVMSTITTSLEEAAIYAVWRWLLPQWDIRLPVIALVAAMAAWLGFSAWLFIFMTRFLKRQPMVGLPSMVGSAGRAAGPLTPEGLVKIRGELWGAASVEGNIRAGEEIVVTGEQGLKLAVRRAKPPIGHPLTGSG